MLDQDSSEEEKSPRRLEQVRKEVISHMSIEEQLHSANLIRDDLDQEQINHNSSLQCLKTMRPEMSKVIRTQC